MEAKKCLIRSIKPIYDRNSKTKKVWSYNVDLQILYSEDEGKSNAQLKKMKGYSAYTMRVPSKQFKKLKLEEGTRVKALEHENRVCAVFDSIGMGFMFTNIPFDMEN